MKAFAVCFFFVVACGGESKKDPPPPSSDCDPACGDAQKCEDGTCIDICTADADCGLGLCCNDICVDGQIDPNACGSCTNSCEASEFCMQGDCLAQAIQSICDFPYIDILQSNDTDDDADDASAQQIKAELEGVCSTSVFADVQESDAAVFESDGFPKLGTGHLLVVVGGRFGRPVVNYLENISGLTPIYFTHNSATGVFSFRKRSDGTDTVSQQLPDESTSVDYFVQELVVEPQLGTAVLILYGTQQPGTTAAVYRFIEEVIPNLASTTSQWTVGQWDDTNSGDAGPGAGDTFQVLESQ